MMRRVGDPMTRRAARAGCLALGLVLPGLAARAGQMLMVTQVNRSFSVRAIEVRRGETVRFTNADEFLHQLYVESAAFNFMSAEQEPGQAIEIRFSAAGAFQVRCEIHPKMRLAVTVD